MKNFWIITKKRVLLKETNLELSTISANKKIRNFVPYVAGIEIIHKCLFECYFCTERTTKNVKTILPLDEFKSRINTLTDNGIKIIDLTPTYRGDVFLIKDLYSYLEFLENNDKIESYFFYFSLVNNTECYEYIDKLLNIINNSNKVTMLFSCYWMDNEFSTFHKITNMSKKVFEIHRENVFYLLKKVKSKNIICVNRTQKEPKHSNKLLLLCKAKNIEVIREDNDVPDNKSLDRTKLCDQYMNCTFVTLDGSVSFCNFGDKKTSIIDNIVDYKSSDLIKQMTSAEMMNNETCKICNFYNPLKDQSFEGFINNYNYLGYN